MITEPVACRHAHTRSTNFSRPSCSRVRPSAASSRSTTRWVAIPAWSVPGCHSTFRPCIRFRRISESCTVPFSAWPMCREPVTFGGGNAMQYGSPGSSGSASNACASIQRSKMPGSTLPAS